ncbi:MULTISPECIES: YceI family protein [unclassified Geodermatophilus]
MTAPLRARPATAGTWTVSDSRTRIAFAVGNLGRVAHGTVTCRTGWVELDVSGDPVRASADLDLDTLDTGIAKRDRDLRRPGLLDIDRHPVMTWRCDRFVPTGDGGWTAEGELSVRGTTAPLTVTGRPEAALDGDRLRVRAQAELDRTAVGIRAPAFLIGRRVSITVDAWLVAPGG